MAIRKNLLLAILGVSLGTAGFFFWETHLDARSIQERSGKRAYSAGYHWAHEYLKVESFNHFEQLLAKKLFHGEGLLLKRIPGSVFVNPDDLRAFELGARDASEKHPIRVSRPEYERFIKMTNRARPDRL